MTLGERFRPLKNKKILSIWERMAWSAPDPGDDHEDEKDKEQDSPELVCS